MVDMLDIDYIPALFKDSRQFVCCFFHVPSVPSDFSLFSAASTSTVIFLKRDLHVSGGKSIKNKPLSFGVCVIDGAKLVMC